MQHVIVIVSDHQTTEVKCAKCGACTSVCPIYRATGRESLCARGRLHLCQNRPGKPSSVYAEIFSQCLLCGACEDACSRGLPIRDIVIEARVSTGSRKSLADLRQTAARRVLDSPLLLKGIGWTGKRPAGLPEESGLLQKLTGFPPMLPSLSQPGRTAPVSGQETKTINYFSGCLAGYLAPEIQEAAVNLLHLTGAIPRPGKAGQTCCGLASYTAGGIDQARKAAMANIEAFEDNADPILTSCSSCYSHMKQYPGILADDPVWSRKAVRFSRRLLEFSTYLADRIPAGRKRTGDGKTIRVAFHDPCHLRFGEEKVTEAPRNLIQAAGIFTLQEIPARCCGHGGLFQLAHPDLSRRIAGERRSDLLRTCPDYLLTTCSGCLLQLNRITAESHLPVQTYHLAVFLNHFLEAEP